jgi:hypothetical protein
MRRPLREVFPHEAWRRFRWGFDRQGKKIFTPALLQSLLVDLLLVAVVMSLRLRTFAADLWAWWPALVGFSFLGCLLAQLVYRCLYGDDPRDEYLRDD